MDKRLQELKRLEEQFYWILTLVKDPGMRVGEWTVQDLVLHLLGWDLATLAALQQAMAGISPTMVPSGAVGDKFNLSARTLWGKFAWTDLVAFYRQTSIWLFNTYQILSENASFPTEHFPVAPIDDDLAHYQEHLAKLKTVLGVG